MWWRHWKEQEQEMAPCWRVDHRGMNLEMICIPRLLHPWLFPAHCFLDPKKCASLLSTVIMPWVSASELVNHGLKSLELWVKINLSYLRLFFSVFVKVTTDEHMCLDRHPGKHSRKLSLGKKMSLERQGENWILDFVVELIKWC